MRNSQSVKSNIHQSHFDDDDNGNDEVDSFVPIFAPFSSANRRERATDQTRHTKCVESNILEMNKPKVAGEWNKIKQIRWIETTLKFHKKKNVQYELFFVQLKSWNLCFALVNMVGAVAFGPNVLHYDQSIT